MVASETYQYDRTIELGHTYAPDRFVPLEVGSSFVDTLEAAALRDIAVAEATDIGRVAIVGLVDDVVFRDNARKSADEWRYSLFAGISLKSLANGLLIRPENISFESKFVPRGRQIIEAVQDMDLPEGHRLTSDGARLEVKTGSGSHRIRLTGFTGVDDPTYPSCEVLDVAWLEHRLTLAPEAATVLPKSYYRQQVQAMKLGALFPAIVDKHVETIFTDDNYRAVRRKIWFSNGIIKG